METGCIAAYFVFCKFSNGWRRPFLKYILKTTNHKMLPRFFNDIIHATKNASHVLMRNDSTHLTTFAHFFGLMITRWLIWLATTQNLAHSLVDDHGSAGKLEHTWLVSSTSLLVYRFVSWFRNKQHGGAVYFCLSTFLFAVPVKTLSSYPSVASFLEHRWSRSR